MLKIYIDKIYLIMYILLGGIGGYICCFFELFEWQKDFALFCCKCGRAFNENEVESFNPIADAMMHYDEVVASPKQKRLCCPKCKSNHLQAIVETATSARTIGNGYSPAKGCLGSLLFGSGGWLLGALGQRQRTIIETQNRNY